MYTLGSAMRLKNESLQYSVFGASIQFFNTGGFIYTSGWIFGFSRVRGHFFE